MRRALLLLLLALAPSAAAAPAKPVIVVPPPKAAAPPPAPVNAPSFVLPAPIPLASARPPGDQAQCKATCSKTLFFCNAGGDDDGCGGRWAQCNAACVATYAPQTFGR
ncbi:MULTISPECIES: hypothetical protein [Caulobacter]|jgi:hypothetical protein|uniref:Kazal-like domain-containing protein n=2 Tax=Pseudomonadota TaxID=1224 RepID=R0CWR2_CAUVI|nr:MULTISPECIES: hypothetical protein [Caulobacter]ENZ80745.1 hypothetical protein OR37_03325 [Caulobacter vibrioides OR37]MBQ1562216.1 hypothetical protein [Caulobacter sp.]